MAIDIIKIENAYLRFKTLYDTLVFKSISIKEKIKNSEGVEKEEDRFEIRSNSRFIHKSNDKIEIDAMVEELNVLLYPFVIKELGKFRAIIDENI